jgi:hypothetical protein
MKYFKSAEGRPIEINSCDNRYRMLILFCLVSIYVGLALGGCDTHKVGASAETIPMKAGNMESLQSATTIQHRIPPIDAAAAPEMETATFALG